MPDRKRPEQLRSHRWFGVDDLRAFGHRSRARQGGYDAPDWQGKPVIGIINTWSDINFCHTHLRARAEDVKRGVLQAGGFPIELPAMSLAETYVKPTTMLYRNLLAMETEELLRSHPIDGAVLLGGCDKTTPGLIMGAISMGMPFIYAPAGPQLNGHWRGMELGSGSDAWKYWDEKRAGRISDADWADLEGGIARSFGTCMVMGTAATMMAIAEALGLTLPGASSIVAPDSAHPRMCSNSGRRIVDMVWEDLTPEKILSTAAFDNAIRVHMAMGGSTNAIIHVVAMARRAGLPMDMNRFDDLSREVPVLANVRPSGEFLMEDFFYAGGLRALMNEMKDMLDLSCMTVTGKTLGDNIEGAQGLQGRRHPHAQQSGLHRRRHRRAHRQPGAARLRHEADRRRSAAVEASRTGACVRGLQPHGARDRPRRSRRHARPRHRAEERRSAGRTRHAGVGHAADPAQIVEAGRQGHAAHFRRAHERHQLRRLHPARRAGKLSSAVRSLSCRPATRSRSTWRSAAFTCTCRTRSWRAAAPPGNSRRRVIRAATARSIPSTSARPTKAAISISWRRSGRCRSRRFIEAFHSVVLKWPSRKGAGIAARRRHKKVVKNIIASGDCDGGPLRYHGVGARPARPMHHREITSMRKVLSALSGASLLLAFLLCASAAHAQATRTWVSGVGDDANPCSRTAPCKTFAGAISKTAAGGEISVLDPGGYGAVTITKSISIINDYSGEAGILASGTNGVTVNAGSSGVVILRGLVIDGAPPTSPGLNGIRFLSGASLHVEKCLIKNFVQTSAGNGHGIMFAPSSGVSELYVANSTFINNGDAAGAGDGGGIFAQPSGSGAALVSINRVELQNNRTGIRANNMASTGSIVVSVKDTNVSGSTNSGISTVTNTGAGVPAATIIVSNSLVVGNGTALVANGSGAVLRIGSSLLTGNLVTVSALNGGTLTSYKNNEVDGNGNNNTPIAGSPLN